MDCEAQQVTVNALLSQLLSELRSDIDAAIERKLAEYVGSARDNRPSGAETRRAAIVRVLSEATEPMGRAAICLAAGIPASKASVVTVELSRLRDKGVVERTGETAGARWRLKRGE